MRKLLTHQSITTCTCNYVSVIRLDWGSYGIELCVGDMHEERRAMDQLIRFAHQSFRRLHSQHDSNIILQILKYYSRTNSSR